MRDELKESLRLHVGDLFDRTSGARFRAGADESAAPESRLCKGQTLHFEHPYQAFPRRGVMGLEVRPDQCVLAAEGAVECNFGDPARAITWSIPTVRTPSS
jgi:hypothetical protein